MPTVVRWPLLDNALFVSEKRLPHDVLTMVIGLAQAIYSMFITHFENKAFPIHQITCAKLLSKPLESSGSARVAYSRYNPLVLSVAFYLPVRF